MLLYRLIRASPLEIYYFGAADKTPFTRNIPFWLNLTLVPHQIIYPVAQLEDSSIPWPLAVGGWKCHEQHLKLEFTNIKLSIFPISGFLLWWEKGQRDGTVLSFSDGPLFLSLTCFAPGNFLLGSRALNRPDIFQFGLDIMDGCWHAYNATPTGIAPESVLFIPFVSDYSLGMEK